MNTIDIHKPTERHLAVPLTDLEKIEFGRNLANLHLEYQRVEVDKKAAADQFKDQLEELDGLISRTARIVRSGEEYRTVECRWRYDFAANKKELMRMDTGEIVETSAITAEERQLMLQIEQAQELSEAANVNRD